MTFFLDRPQLLDGFRRGEREILELVYRHYVADVERLLRLGFVAGDQARTRVPALVDGARLADAVQDVFVRAFAQSARVRYGGVRPYRPLLLRVAKNLRIDQLRTRKWEVSVSTLSPPSGALIDVDQLIEQNLALPSAPAPSPQEAREWGALSSRARAYIEGLPCELRQVVALRYEEGLSGPEVTERLGISRRHLRTLEAQIEAGLKRFLARSR